MHDPDGMEGDIRQLSQPIKALSTEASAEGTNLAQTELPGTVSNRAVSPNDTGTKEGFGNGKLWGIVIIVLLSALIMTALYISSLPWTTGSIIAMGSKLRSLLKTASTVNDCNERGVWTASGGCYCDIAWQGPYCDHQLDILRPAGAVRLKNVLLVVEYFSPVDVGHENAIHYVTLASLLARSGHIIEVLVVGPKSMDFGRLQKLYAEKAIRLARLPDDELRFDNGEGSRTSYLVMRHILNESHRRKSVWEIIIFAGSRGVGHHTITSQRQGLLCIGSHLVIIHDTLTPLRRAQLVGGSQSALVSDRELLRMDYLQQRAIELADTVIFTSKAYLDAAMEQGWRVHEHVYVVPHLAPPVANEGSEVERAEELIPAKQTHVSEFVYIGPLDIVGGLNVFLNAIDDLLSRDQRAHKPVLRERQLEITFLGWSDVVNDEGDLAGKHYIDARAHDWGSRVRWSMSNEPHLKKMIKYLTEPGKGRIAIIPAIGDISPFFLHQALRAGVPVIASNLQSIQEIIHVQDHHDVLFSVNDTASMAKHMLDVLNHGGINNCKNSII